MYLPLLESQNQQHNYKEGAIMLFHLSFSAHNPYKVASVLAELMNGDIQPFPAVPNAWIAFANDELGTAIEVYPKATVLTKGPHGAPVLFSQTEEITHPTPFHFALKTPLHLDQIIAIGKRENWAILPCSRGGHFDVIEIWVENQFLIEAITPDKQEEAIRFHNSQSWEKAISGGVESREVGT